MASKKTSSRAKRSAKAAPPHLTETLVEVSPADFEKQVERIVRSLEGQGAKVTWDDHIPDPDNPEQPRQVDITIRRNSTLAIVECRLHSRRQDVKWIEEMCGRRISLNADEAIAVSASGFTEGAIRKGQRLGVALKRLQSLTLEEIIRWGQGISLVFRYIQFESLQIYAVVSELFQGRVAHPLVLQKEDGSDWQLDHAIRQIARKLFESVSDGNVFAIQIFTPDLYVSGVKAPELLVAGNWRRVEIRVPLPLVSSYGSPDENPLSGDAIVEKAWLSDTEIHHLRDSVLPTIDMESVPAPRQGVLQDILMDLGKPRTIKAIGVIGPHPGSKTMYLYRLQAIRKDSGKYHAVLSPIRERMLWLPG